jgi:DNA-binding MarR family transcriptional regulator
MEIPQAYARLVHIISGAETTTSAIQVPRYDLDDALEALPALRRWLRPGGAHRLAGVPADKVVQQPYPAGHIRMLMHLYRRGPSTVGELARDLGLSYPAVTECVAGLEAAGRVVKERSLADKRQVLVQLTLEAHQLASELVAERKRTLDGVLNQLSPAERQGFIKGLMLLAKSVEPPAAMLPAVDGQPPQEEAANG